MSGKLLQISLSRTLLSQTLSGMKLSRMKLLQIYLSGTKRSRTKLSGRKPACGKHNAHGDVVMLLDAATREPAGTYSYDAFGTLVSQTGEADNSILYAGYSYDFETGLYDCVIYFEILFKIRNSTYISV